MKLNNKILKAIDRGIQLALDDYDDNVVSSKKAGNYKELPATKYYLDLMNETVDLGLPSGTLWCKYNLGVNPNQLSKLEDWCGEYYAWGESEINNPNCDWNSYKFVNGDNGKLTKYCNNSENGLNGFIDNLTELLPEDDVAFQFKKLHNFKFHIPTKEQFEELIDYTNNYWVKNYNPNKLVHNTKNDGGIKGLHGQVFEGKNGNQMFIPAAGFYSSITLYSIGDNAHLWTSTLATNNPCDALFAYIDFFGIDIYDDNRSNRLNIRPVTNL